MFAKLIRSLFSRPEQRPIEPPAWQEESVVTLSDEAAPGITSTISYSTGYHGFVQVVGESHYQETLLSLKTLFEVIQRDPPVFTAVLVPEPDNPHDSNAVAVKTEGNAICGYLSREVAKSYHRTLAKQRQPVTCPAKLVGGESGKHLGVVLDFESVRKLKDQTGD